jgi:predicted AAA+ superfamily ATPase
MFARQLLSELEKWRLNKPRKPLIIRGARQVGKTTLVNQFAVNTSKADPLPPAQCDPLKILLTLG